MSQPHLPTPETRQVSCQNCPLRRLDTFRPFDKEELAFVAAFKKGEFAVEARAMILQEGASSAHLYTVLSGWGFRYTLLPDGRRQILNFVLPGDLIGLQASVAREMKHSIEALTGMLLCVFQREELWNLYQRHPGLAYDITWLAALEEQMLDRHLLSVGRRTALERMAYLLLHLHHRAHTIGLADRQGFSPPITQYHLADALGMSVVHTNKTLKKLYQSKLIRWKNRRLEFLDLEALREIAHFAEEQDVPRPLI
ncbi:MAG: Crp/Fnr family transcriptional regulator [Rhizobiales bacterium]|nr:Crp/Fnr family transcriptional regulator [Hyphomicrobiales bacterium]